MTDWKIETAPKLSEVLEIQEEAACVLHASRVLWHPANTMPL